MGKAGGALVWQFALDPDFAVEAARHLGQADPTAEHLDLALAHPSLRPHAERLARELLERHARTGSWLGEAVADVHHLSALSGLAGVAYQLIRLETPGLGSLLLPAP